MTREPRDDGGFKPSDWERFYEFTGTNVQEYPLPSAFPLERARLLDSLAQELSAREPSAVCANGVPSREALASAQKESEEIRARMIAVQEELDWEVYRLYGLIDEDLTYGADDLPGLALGERAFEIALARVRRGNRVVRAARVQADHRDPGALASRVPGTRPAAGWSSSQSTRTSGCWRSPSTSGAGRRSRGTSGRNGHCGVGCSTDWRTGGSGSTARAARSRRASGSSRTR